MVSLEAVDIELGISKIFCFIVVPSDVFDGRDVLSELQRLACHLDEEISYSLLVQLGLLDAFL